MLIWCLLGAALIAGAIVLYLASPLFEWQREVADMPASGLAFGLATAGAAYCLLIPLIPRTLPLIATVRRRVFWAAVVAGVLVRVLLAASEPAMEDDYYRYLWEGALTAHLVNPYKLTPEEARRADPASPIGALAREGEAVLLRVNHPGMTSNYPPLAQVAFAVAHRLSPWNLAAWRALALAFDGASFLLLLALLKEARRDRLWAMLYWWNPIVIKEVANSAHMDGLVVVLVLGGLLLAARRRHYSGILVLSLAMGAKLWPALLVPLLLRPLWGRPWAMIAGGLTVAAAALAWATPVLGGGLHSHDGFVAFARLWRTNSALFPTIEDLLALLLDRFGRAEHAAVVTQGIFGACLVALALCLAWRPLEDARDLCVRTGVLTLWLVLLSPAQFPWYVMWTIPFAALRPAWGIAAMTTLVPLYYLSFHFIARGEYAIFSHGIVWAIWCPVWLAVLADAAFGTRDEAPASPTRPG